ncbi:hypothetical protein CYMTET_49222 [Cymbomonas tetramitiformis]|uniref:Uncharacterized protein n=1 Tax=Cymbomonas tetramitiformis TaxID=36881 RepID=A0AAE0EUR4_9CHLO|nr:hypothetical protein CYMTET_49222 [Cymbomonas tetramitiformis]
MPATAGRVPMPAGNRVTTSNALKVSDRWTAIVGEDPYAQKEAQEGNMMEKLWADPRLHGDKRRIGTDDAGKAVFAVSGQEKREARKMDAAAAREAEFLAKQQQKREREEEATAKNEAREAKLMKKEKKKKKDKKSKKSKDKKRKKDKKDKKDKKEKKEKKSKDRKKDDSSDEEDSDMEEERKEKKSKDKKRHRDWFRQRLRQYAYIDVNSRTFPPLITSIHQQPEQLPKTSRFPEETVTPCQGTGVSGKMQKESRTFFHRTKVQSTVL